jgi:hypothetical protein
MTVTTLGAEKKRLIIYLQFLLYSPIMGAYTSLPGDFIQTEPVFWVPPYYNLTTSQLQQMTEQGLQPGVPFRIGYVIM